MATLADDRGCGIAAFAVSQVSIADRRAIDLAPSIPCLANQCMVDPFRTLSYP